MQAVHSDFRTVGLATLGILDITGIPFIIEGIVGRHAYGREMDSFARAERLRMGACFLAIGIFSVVKGVKGARARAAARAEAKGHLEVKVEAKTKAKSSGTKGRNLGGKKFKNLSKAQRKQAISERMAKHKIYDPAKRTDAELATDTNPKQKFGERLADAKSRVLAAEAEIICRRIIARYEGLGESPRPFDIVQNDLLNADAHTLGNGGNGRHNPALPLERQLDTNGNPNGVQTIEGRIHGDAPWAAPENNSSRWFSAAQINRTINRYLIQNWEQVRSSLAENGNHKVVVNAGEMVGDCYRNRNFGLGGARVSMGPFQSPLARLTFVLIPGSPPSFYVVTSFPELPLNIKSPIVDLY